MADPSGGPVLACSSIVLPCPAVPSGSLSGLHLPSFSTNLVSTTALEDTMVTTTTPGGQRVSICTCTQTSSHLTTFTSRPGSSLYTLTTEPPQVAACGQVSASGPVAAPCSCRLLSHQTLLWHHRLGHPSLPRLRGMHSRLLVPGIPRCLPPLPPSPAPPCLPCVEGRQRAAPHSSFPSTTSPLQTLHMDVKGEDPDVLIPWIHAVRLQLRERFREDLPVLRLHSDRGALFPCHSLHLPWLSPDAPGWQFYHPTSCRVLSSQDVMFDESVSFYRLFPYRTSPLPPPPLFLALGPPPVDPLPPEGHAPSDSGAVGGGAARGAASGGAEHEGAELGGAETEGGELGGAEIEGAESRGAEPEGAELGGAESGGAESGGVEPRGTASAGGHARASPRHSCWQEPLLPQQLREWFARRKRLGSGAAGARGPAAGGTGAGGARATIPGGAGVSAGAGGTGGAGAAGPGGACTRGTRAVGAGGVGGAGDGDPGVGGTGARDHGAGGTGAGDPGARGAGAGDPGAGGARAAGAGAGGAEAGCAGARGAGAGGVGDGGTGAGGTGAGGAGAGGAGAGGTGAGGTVQWRPFFVPPPPSSLPPPDSVLRQVLSLPSSTGLTPRLLCPPPHHSQPQLHPDSPLLAPSPDAEQTDTHIMALRPVPCPRPPPIPGTHIMALRPSSVPLRVALPSPPASSLTDGLDPSSDLVRAANPTVTRLLATIVTDPSFESAAASALVAELVDFAAACRLDYATSLVAESESEDFECLAAAVPHLVAMLLAPEGDPDAPDIPTPCSYAEAITVPPSGANIVDGMWIFRGSQHKEIWLRRPPGFIGSFLAALGFAPSIADPSLFRLTDTSLPPFYILVYVNDLAFSTAVTEALTLVKSELQKRHTCTDLGELRSYLGLHITREKARRTITLTESHMVHHVLQRFGILYSSPQSTPLPTGYSLFAPPSDASVEPSGPYPELMGCLITSGMGLVLGGRGPVVLTGHADASWVEDLATQRSSQGYTLSLGSSSISRRSTRSSSVLSSTCVAEIYAGAMAAQDLHWLTYLLTDLGERPRSPPFLCVDNKAMIAMCQEHRLEQRTKHIALRYFLARELQQRGQLRLAYVATRANATDIFTKALQPGDHQRFCTVLGLVMITVLFVLFYVTLHVNWPCGQLLVLGMCGDFPRPRAPLPLGSSAPRPLRSRPRGPSPLGPLLLTPPGPSAPTAATATAAPAAITTAATAATATAATAATATAATAAPACCATMASLRVLAFDHEGRPIQFDTWLDDLQLYLLSDSMDSVSLFDLASCTATAPPATADSGTRSQWLTRDAAARLAIRNHLPLAECAHFGQHRTAQALYDAVVTRYSSVKRQPGSPPAFKARYVARGFSQRQGVDYFQTISPTPKMTTLRVLLHVAAQRDYELHSLDFSTTFLQGSLHEEIWLRRPPGFTRSFSAGIQWSLWRPVYGLRQAPREWHDTLRTTLAALGFAPSTADPSLFLRTDTSLPLFYVLVYVDDLVFAIADTEAMTLVKSELQKRHICTDLGPSALRLPVLLATAHSSVY
ncbi:unnamed protein product [Closterium sp. NIES-53]